MTNKKILVAAGDDICAADFVEQTSGMLRKMTQEAVRTFRNVPNAAQLWIFKCARLK